MNTIRASVAMAVYNGEQYIHQQIDSILERMGADDELVISYDRSTDRTREIIDTYAQNDSRVHVVENDHPGVQSNFTNAVMHCRGQYIFLSDQDDVWIGDKINEVIECFQQTGADLVVHDGYMADENLNPGPKTIFEIYGKYNNPILNIIKCNFWGCCMAFKSSVRDYACPFPTEGKVGHDLWLGIQVGLHGKIARLDKCLMKHRLHGNNVTADRRRPHPDIIRHRLTLIKLRMKHRV